MLLVKKFSLILRLECGFIFTAFSFLSLGTTPQNSGRSVSTYKYKLITA